MHYSDPPNNFVSNKTILNFLSLTQKNPNLQITVSTIAGQILLYFYWSHKQMSVTCIHNLPFFNVNAYLTFLAPDTRWFFLTRMNRTLTMSRKSRKFTWKMIFKKAFYVVAHNSKRFKEDKNVRVCTIWGILK